MRSHHLDTLLALARLTNPSGDMYVPLYPLVKETKLDKEIVRRSCRYLVMRGLAGFHKALCTDEGQSAWSGYCITEAGKDKLKIIFPIPPEQETNND